MAVFKCKICGGTIEPREGGIGICDSCGTKQTISNTNDEKKMNLLDRANHFRMQNEFDKALAIYEQVLAEDTNDSDIYYAIALCRYGITYVDDPTTKKKIPTINRMQNKMFTKDPDYEMAINKASSGQSSLYEEEGKYIDKVQTGIMDITKNEKPYDVFICYKETDDSGERTRDSVLANDLYHGLANEGFKVFFARITLEGKLGTAYEPYIFSALNSSKVMVVLGTKKEYFDAVWVKNEWSRFLSLMKDDSKKTLIPAYRDMDPYDLPDEFSNLQALDMSKIGFMQDLIRGIKKLTNKDNESTSHMLSGENSSKVAQLLKRVGVFLTDGDFESADEYCERALDIDAENSDVYLFKVAIENKCRSIEDLESVHEDLNTSNNFSKALKFANDKQKNRLIEINNEGLYRSAKKTIESGKYAVAIPVLEKITGYKDSDTLKKECQENIESMLKKQAEEKRIQEEERKRLEEERKERERKEEEERKRLEEERKEREKKEAEERKARNRIAAERARKRLIKITKIAVPILVLVLIVWNLPRIYRVIESKKRDGDYKKRQELLSKNRNYFEKFQNLKKFDTLKLGKDPNGEYIEWIVIENDNNYIKLLSKHIIDYYDPEGKGNDYLKKYDLGSAVKNLAKFRLNDSDRDSIRWELPHVGSFRGYPNLLEMPKKYITSNGTKYANKKFDKQNNKNPISLKDAYVVYATKEEREKYYSKEDSDKVMKTGFTALGWNNLSSDGGCTVVNENGELSPIWFFESTNGKKLNIRVYCGIRPIISTTLDNLFELCDLNGQVVFE
jgi:hypothetical protein